MSQDPPSKLERRVVAAAEAALSRQKYVAPLDVLIGIGWLPSTLVDGWRQGRVPHLEERLPVGPDKRASALEFLQRWAQINGLEPSETDYVAGSRDRRNLRFTADGAPAVERAYRTHWISPELSAAKRERLAQRQSAPPDIVVVLPIKDWTCAGCGGSDEFLKMEDAGPLCLTCVDMDHLVFLPAGDAALTRRAKKASGLSAVVVRWSRSRKRYERQGTLVEESALERAEEQCLADEEVRMRRRERDRARRADEDLEFQSRLTKEIVRLFPGCPAPRAEAIARHTGIRGSGRVGRTAAGRALDEEKITLAVVASIRHEDTDYDSILMSGVPRETARDRVRDDIDRILEHWRG
ncbi:MAG: DUF2293 domain-containing protein [Streptosporangiales bacterium]|nr:DUF2293 domain-containing protein [Streptosporangiales bacterium]